MNQDRNRRRLLWVAAIGAVLLLAMVFVTALAPSRPAASEPILTPGPTAVGTDTAPVVGGGFGFDAGDAFSLAWRLGLVALVIAASIAALRWWGRKAAAPRSTTGFIRIVDTLGISNGRSVHLLALGERVIVVGATTQQLTLLGELTPEEASRVLEEREAGSQQPLSAFAAELFNSMRPSAVASPPRPGESAPVSARVSAGGIIKRSSGIHRGEE